MREFENILKEFTNLYKENDYGHFPLRIKLSAREEKIGIGAGNLKLAQARYTGPPSRGQYIII
jgi:hypothetical protein